MPTLTLINYGIRPFSSVPVYSPDTRGRAIADHYHGGPARLPLLSMC
jgi:hypothetical protein